MKFSEYHFGRCLDDNPVFLWVAEHAAINESWMSKVGNWARNLAKGRSQPPQRPISYYGGNPGYYRDGQSFQASLKEPADKQKYWSLKIEDAKQIIKQALQTALQSQFAQRDQDVYQLASKMIEQLASKIDAYKAEYRPKGHLEHPNDPMSTYSKRGWNK